MVKLIKSYRYNISNNDLFFCLFDKRSLACIIFELVSLKKAFPGLNRSEVIKKVTTAIPILTMEPGQVENEFISYFESLKKILKRFLFL